MEEIKVIRKDFLSEEVLYKAKEILRNSTNDSYANELELLKYNPKVRLALYILIRHEITEEHGICTVDLNYPCAPRHYRTTYQIMNALPEIDKQMPKRWRRMGFAFRKDKQGFLKRKYILNRAIKELYQYFND